MKRTLIISVSGIGNTILQGPFIRRVLEDGGFEIDCLFGNQAMAQVFKGHPALRKTFIIPRSLSKYIGLIATLKREKYDLCISCFPSNRPQFHLLPFLIGAKKRLIHDYGNFNATLSFLSNEKVKARKDVHDVVQNLGLLSPIGIRSDGADKTRLYFALSDEDEHEAENLLKKWGLKGKVLGIHAGCGPLQEKKWPLQKFCQVAEALIKEKYFQYVLLFGGPEEAAEKHKLAEMINRAVKKAGTVMVVNATLGVTAALIKRTSLFLSNDSGLMHVAAAVGKRVVGIFGPTNWNRTAPWGNGATFIKPDSKVFPCAPCLKYPFSSTRATIRCEAKGQNLSPPCLESIGWEQVFNNVLKMLTL